MAILDQFGREIRPRDLRTPERREIALRSVRERWSGYPSSGLTPSGLAAILREADAGEMTRWTELCEEMEEKDPHIASLLGTRKLAVQGLDWEVLPAAETAPAKYAADLCRDTLESLDFDETELDLLDALFKGFSLMEIFWNTEGREWRPSELRWVHPKHVTFRDSLVPRLLTEDEPVNGVDLPPFKFLWHRYKARSGLDTRAGLGRPVSWYYLFKAYAIKDWIQFCETFGQPLRIGKYPAGASSADKDALLDAVAAIGADAAAVISQATDIEFKEAHKYGSIQVYQGFVNYADGQQAKAILGQTLTSDSGGGSGSFALGRVHDDVRQDLVEADGAALEKTLVRQLFRPLVGFNRGWDVPVPFLRINTEPPEDLQAAGNLYKILREINQPMSREHVSQKFGVPLPQKGETPLEAPGAASPAPASETAKNIRFQGANRTDPGQAALDDLAAGLPADAISAALDPVLDLVKSSNSFEEIQEKLFALHPRMDSAEFERLLGRAMFAADLWGRLRAREEAGE